MNVDDSLWGNSDHFQYHETPKICSIAHFRENRWIAIGDCSGIVPSTRFR